MHMRPESGHHIEDVPLAAVDLELAADHGLKIVARLLSGG